MMEVYNVSCKVAMVFMDVVYVGARCHRDILC